MSIGTQSESVRNPWAIVVPNGPAAARSASTWIHWESSVAAAKRSIRACETSSQLVGPSSTSSRSENTLMRVPSEARWRLSTHSESVERLVTP